MHGPASSAQPTAGPWPAAFDGRRLATLVNAALPEAASSTGPAPGLAVAVSCGPRVIWSHCVGLASLEHGVPITPQTRFRIASISKQMAAALIVMLADDGVLGLDDPLHAHLPAFAAFDPPVLLRHLLTMTSGLHEVSHLGWLATGDLGSSRISQAEWRRLMLSQTTPGFAAGSRYLYNNANYLLLQWVAEEATGQTLAVLLRERLFEPLGMHDTLLPEVPTRVPDRLASGYRKAADLGFDTPSGWHNSGAAGGVLSSLDDMARWALNLRDNRLRPADLAQRLAEPFVHPNGARSHYGLGLATGVHAGRAWLGHAGGLAGFSTDQIVVPSHDLAVTVLANRDDIKTMRLSRRIADHLIDGHSLLDACFADPPAPVADALKARCGVYVGAAARRVVEIAEGPGLLTANGLLLGDGGGPVRSQVLIGDEPVTYEWLGADQVREVHASGAQAPLHRAPLVPPDVMLAAELAGRYGIDAIGARWVVERKGADADAPLRLRIDSPWREADAFDLLQAAPDLLVMAPAGGKAQPSSVLEIERDGHGRVVALIGHFDRSRALRLARETPCPTTTGERPT
jgi:CubicO group peptidase (beta-lactamase class C family)